MNKKNTTLYLIYLLIIGFLAKVISLTSRIVLSRSIGIEAMSLFALVNPLIVLVITFASLSLPTVISTLISKNANKRKQIFATAFIISSVMSVILMILVLLLGRIIAFNLLHNPNTLPAVYATALLIPLTSISSNIKGYFLGSNEIVLTSYSQIFEEGSRLIFIIFFIGSLTQKNGDMLAAYAVIALCVGEVFQSLYMIFFSKPKYHRNYKKALFIVVHQEKYAFKEMLKLSIPLTLSRAVTSITYFFEPIIVTSLLINIGLSSQNITLDYGILSSYVMPLLLLPGFFSLAFSNFMLPKLSKFIADKEYQKGKSIFLYITGICLFLGLGISIFYAFFGDHLLQFIYHTTEGKDLIKVLALPFLIYYIETPIQYAMIALNLQKKSFKSTVWCSILRIGILLFLTPHLHTFAVAIATLGSVYLNVLLNGIDIFLFFKRKNVKTTL